MKDSLNIKPRFSALLPLGLFLAVFVGSGVYFQSIGTSFAFYQVSAPLRPFRLSSFRSSLA